VLAWMVLAPAIRFFGDPMNPLHPADKVIRGYMSQRDKYATTTCSTSEPAPGRGGGRVQFDSGAAVDRRFDLEQRQRFGAVPVAAARRLRRRRYTAPIKTCLFGLSGLEASRWCRHLGRLRRCMLSVFDWIPELQMNALGALADCAVRLSLRHGVSSRVDGRNRALVQQSDLGQ